MRGTEGSEGERGGEEVVNAIHATLQRWGPPASAQPVRTLLDRARSGINAKPQGKHPKHVPLGGGDVASITAPNRLATVMFKRRVAL
mgnify:CR=1 FL=1